MGYCGISNVILSRVIVIQIVITLMLAVLFLYCFSDIFSTSIPVNVITFQKEDSQESRKKGGGLYGWKLREMERL